MKTKQFISMSMFYFDVTQGSFYKKKKKDYHRKRKLRLATNDQRRI